jgi:hypothetical protein
VIRAFLAIGEGKRTLLGVLRGTKHDAAQSCDAGSWQPPAGTHTMQPPHPAKLDTITIQHCPDGCKIMLCRSKKSVTKSSNLFNPSQDDLDEDDCPIVYCSGGNCCSE